MTRVWIGSKGQFEIKSATTLKVLSSSIGVSYSTMKSKAARAEMFTIIGDDLSVWFVVRSVVQKVGGRGSRERFGSKAEVKLG